MHTIDLIGGKFALLAVVAALSASSSVQAQFLSRWGNPVISFGWTPYDWDETGLGHYYGRPPFVPRHGYYLECGPAQYSPWIEWPGMPINGRKIMPLHVPPSANDEVPPPDAALVIVKLPAEAELWFDKTKSTQEGSYRRFVTPPLKTDRPLVYTLRVQWHIKDAELTRVEKVHVEPGKTIIVNFLTVDSWTGVHAETLSVPRRLP